MIVEVVPFEHPDATADRIVLAALGDGEIDPLDALHVARQTYRAITRCTKETARRSIKRAIVRAALKSQDQAVREKGMALHTR